MADDVDTTKPQRALGGSTRAEPRSNGPRLLPLGRSKGSAVGGGMVGALIVGALALVVALMALTIAIGRTPTDAAAGPRPTATASEPAGPTTFASPEQTGRRWTADPIVTGVPQYQPSYEPTPTETPSQAETTAPETTAADPGTGGEVSVVNPPPPTQAVQPPQGEGSAVGRDPDRPGRP